MKGESIMALSWLFIGIGLCFISFVIAALNMLMNRESNSLFTVHVSAMIGMASGAVIVIINIIKLVVHYLDALSK